MYYRYIPFYNTFIVKTLEILKSKCTDEIFSMRIYRREERWNFFRIKSNKLSHLKWVVSNLNSIFQERLGIHVGQK